MANYKITAVTVEVRPGVTLTAEIASPADLKQLLEDLNEEGFGAATSTNKSRHAPRSSPEEHGERVACRPH